MPNIQLKKRAFYVDGKPTYISAAEIQYFRTKRTDWKNVIRLAKEANNNAVATYIPWSWHEYEEGTFDFDGRTHPRRNLRAFLDLIQKAGLMFISKPGPYVYGEIVDGGHPQWMFDSYPEVLALGPDGVPPVPTHTPVVTYMHPTYLAKVKNWYTALVQQVTSTYDNICLWQVDNETCYTYQQNWKQGTAVDYHPILKKQGLFEKFLKENFHTIARLNKRYGSSYRSFAKVQPPRDPSTFIDGKNVARGIDWIDYKSWLIGHHHKQLAEMLYELGVKGPFCANQPCNGLTGYFPRLQKIYNDDRFTLGIAHVDHCGEVFLYNVGKMVGNATLFGAWAGSPLVGSLESQASNISGMWSPSAGGSYEIYYRMLVAAGLNFHTPYWFNDGDNVPGRGFYMTAHHFESPVDHNGNTRYHYDVIRRVNGFLMKHPDIVTLEPEYRVALGHCREYNTKARVVAGGMDAQKDLGCFRNALVWTGNLFTWTGLEDQDLSTKRPLIVVSYEALPRIVQQKLVDFVKRGGRLILAGHVPTKDENQKPCRILAKALGVRRTVAVPSVRPRATRPVTMIEMFGGEIISQEPVRGFEGTIDPIATSGTCTVGFKKHIDKGTAYVLGFFFRGYTLSERACLCRLLGQRYEEGYLQSFTRKRGRRKLTTYLNMGEETETVRIGKRTMHVPPKNARFVYFDGTRTHIEP